MYTYIYYFIYSAFKKKHSDADWVAALTTPVFMWIHCLCIIALIQKATNIAIHLYPQYIASMPYGVQKYTLLPFAMAICYFIGRYFVKRHKQIEKKYDGKKMLTWKNFIIVALLLFFIPIFICYLLSPKA